MGSGGTGAPLGSQLVDVVGFLGTWDYQNQDYDSGMIFDFFACGPAENKRKGKKVIKGAYPAGFLKRLKKAMAEYWPEHRDEILHICAGSLSRDEGLLLDNDTEQDVDYVANAESFAEMVLLDVGHVKVTIADPPYNKVRARDYYNQTGKLNIIKMLKEMAKVTEVGGFVILLDQTSPAVGPHIPNLKRVALIGVTSVPNQDCRLCTVWRKVSE